MLRGKDMWYVARFLGLCALAGALSVGLGVAVVKQPLYTLAVPAVLLVGMVAARPYWGAVSLVFLAFVLQGLVGAHVLPSAGTLFIDAVSLSLTLAMLVRVTSARQRPTMPVGGVWALAFLGIAVVSAGFTGATLVNAAVGVRQVVKFLPLLFAPSVFEWSEKQMRTVVWTLVGLTIVQTPFALWEFATRSSSSGDSVGGTLGTTSSGVLTVFIIGMVTLVAGMYIYRVSPGWRILAAMLLVCVPPALNETKVFFVAAPLIWVLMIVPRVGRNVGGVGRIVLALVAVFTIVAVGYSTFYDARMLTPTSFLQEEQGDTAKNGVLNRLPQVEFSAALIAQAPATLALGFGPGAASRSVVGGTVGALVAEYGMALYNTVFLSWLMLELGVAGLAAFLALLGSVFAGCVRLERQDEEPFWQATAMGVQGIILTWAFMSIYTATFNADGLAATLWVLSGVCMWRITQRRMALAVVPATHAERLDRAISATGSAPALDTAKEDCR